MRPVPDDPHPGVLNPRRLLDLEPWSSLLGRIPPCTWGFHRLNPGRSDDLTTRSTPIRRPHDPAYTLHTVGYTTGLYDYSKVGAMPDPKLAEHARDALEAFREIEAGCTHLCGCRRASSVVDSTIRIALELGGWTVRGLAAHMGVSPGLIQKRAGRSG